MQHKKQKKNAKLWGNLWESQQRPQWQNSPQGLSHKSSNPLLLHHPHLVLLLHLGTSGPQNERGPRSARSGTVTVRFQLHWTEQTPTFVPSFRQICGIHSFHPHQGAIQLFTTSKHSRPHLQPIPRIHRAVAPAISHTGWRNRWNQQILSSW